MEAGSENARAQTSHEVTAALGAVKDGVPGAQNRLIQLVYEELRRLARQRAPQSLGPATLCPTALVHEAYLRLMDGQQLGWADRNHFLGAAACAMRSAVVDYARHRNAQKRGGGAVQLELSPQLSEVDQRVSDVLDVHEALDRLALVSSRASRVVELLYFGGLQEEEAAAVLDVSARTVRREWRFARAWLFDQLRTQ